jgi:hypothetical protein
VLAHRRDLQSGHAARVTTYGELRHERPTWDSPPDCPGWRSLPLVGVIGYPI